MKHMLLLGGVLLLNSAIGQTTLFQDNFETGSANWTLNGGSGLNQWIVNAEYVDGSGFGIVPNTPNQPGGVTNGPNSAYMHIHNTQACSSLSICNASFDTGSSSNQSATQTNAVVTTGMTNVTLSFIYLCDGASGSAYGVVEYSTNGGSSWTAASSNYSGVSVWTNATISLPAFDNQANLKFRFRWQNGSSGNDPAFAVDEVLIVGTPGTSTAVATGTLASNQYCSNTSTAISIPFNVTGTVNAGNVYTAQLSSNTGSFASPTNIGTLNSTSTGSLVINGNIPAGLAIGNQYRIRVNASDPAIIGVDNGVNISVSAPPTVSVISLPANGHICPTESATMSASGGSTFVWSPAGSLDNSNAQTVSATPAQTTVYTVVGTDANGCSNSTTYTITVDACLGLSENEEIQWMVYPNPTTDILTVDYPESFSKIELVDQSGRVIVTSKDAALSIGNLTSGLYTLRVFGTSGIYTKQVVKK
jgi:hypothetical protein